MESVHFIFHGLYIFMMYKCKIPLATALLQEEFCISSVKNLTVFPALHPFHTQAAP